MPSPTWRPTKPPTSITQPSAARTSRRPSAKYVLVARRRASWDDPSRSANRIAAGRRAGRATSCMRSRWPGSSSSSIADMVLIPIGGFVMIAEPTTRPAASVTRDDQRCTSMDPVPLVDRITVPTLVCAVGSSASTRSWNSGSIAARTASRSPSASARTRFPHTGTPCAGGHRCSVRSATCDSPLAPAARKVLCRRVLGQLACPEGPAQLRRSS